MEALLFAIAGFVLIAAGSGTALLLLPRGRRLASIELASLSILLGSGFISLSSFLIGLLFGGWPMRVAVAVVALLLAIIGWLSRRRVELVWWPVHSWRDWAVSVILVVQLLIIVWGSLRLTFAFDGLFIWDFKALLIHQSNGTMPLEFYSRSPWQFPHPNYPLLVPLTDSWFYGWMEKASQGMRKLVSPIYYLAIIGTLISSGTRLGASRWLGVLPAVLFSFIPSVIVRTSAGEADLPVAAFYLASAVYLLEYWKTNDTRVLLIAGVVGAMLPWVKQEGVILWLCLMGIALIRTSMQRQWRALAAMALPGLLWIGFWRVFLLLTHASVHPAYLPVRWSTISKNLVRVPEIARWLLREVSNAPNWSLTWLLPIAGLAQLFFGKRGRGLILAWLALVFVPTFLYAGIYVFSSWDPYTEHINTSLARLLLHLAPLALFGIALIPGESIPPDKVKRLVAGSEHFSRRRLHQ